MLGQLEENAMDKAYRIISCLIIGMAACLVSYSAEERVLIDFGKADISSVFNEAQGGLVFSLDDCPKELEGADKGLRSGKVLSIKSPAKGFLYTKDGILPQDLDECESISVEIYSSFENAPAVFEIQFIEGVGKSKFWRKVELAKAGLTKVAVPLRFMRQSSERTPSWKNVRHLGFFFRTGLDLSVISITLLSKTGKTAVISPEELSEIAFPETPASQVKIVKDKDFIIVSNSKELEIESLEKKMGELFGKVKKDFEGIKTSVPDSPPTLAVFATQDEYRKFTPRFAEMLLGSASPPTSGGYTVNSIATSSWDPSKGTMRPVYFHEMLHSWMDKVCGFPSSNGDWIQEGFANYYQLMFFPQDDLGQIILDGIGNPKMHMPLKELCSGKRIPMDRYWQALSVIAMLENKDGYKEKMPKLLEVLLERRSTDLNPVINDVLGVDMGKFSSDWKEFCTVYAKQLKR